MNKQQLASKIWESANKMRSKIEANEYKDYILGFIVSVNIFFTIFTNVFSPIAPTRMRRIRQRGCAAFGV